MNQGAEDDKAARDAQERRERRERRVLQQEQPVERPSANRPPVNQGAEDDKAARDAQERRERRAATRVPWNRRRKSNAENSRSSSSNLLRIGRRLNATTRHHAMTDAPEATNHNAASAWSSHVMSRQRNAVSVVPAGP